MKGCTLEVGKGVPFQKVIDGEQGDVIAAHNGVSQSDIKYNGHRDQLHMLNGQPLFFSKSLEILDPLSFPEISPELEKKYRRDAAIFDAELVGAAGSTEGLVAVQTRAKMKNPGPAAMAQYPLHLRIFDVLYFNGSLLHHPLEERRQLLEKIVGGTNVLPAETRIVRSEEDIDRWYNEVVHKRKEEGIVCKDLHAPYLVGKRTKQWIRLVEYKTLDLVVAGFYKGEGREADAPFAAVLLCAYNEEKQRYETLVKCGVTGEIRDELAQKIFSRKQNALPSNITFNPKLFTKKAYERKVPFAYVNPDTSLVVTVRSKGGISYADNWHSCGGTERAYSLLIPIIDRIRDPIDKKSQEATTTQQIRELYKEQREHG